MQLIHSARKTIMDAMVCAGRAPLSSNEGRDHHYEAGDIDAFQSKGGVKEDVGVRIVRGHIPMR